MRIFVVVAGAVGFNLDDQNQDIPAYDFLSEAIQIVQRISVSHRTCYVSFNSPLIQDLFALHRQQARKKQVNLIDVLKGSDCTSEAL